jgi:hypothetical protein
MCDLSVLNIAISNWTRDEWESKIVEELQTEALGTRQNKDKNKKFNNGSNNNDDLLTAQSGKKWQRWKKPVFHTMVCVCGLLITPVINYIYIYSMTQQTLVDPRTPHYRSFTITRWHTHTHTHTHTYSVGFLWTGDQPVAEKSTWENTTLTKERETERPPCYRRDSNPQSQKASGRRPTP